MSGSAKLVLGSGQGVESYMNRFYMLPSNRPSLSQSSSTPAAFCALECKADPILKL